MVSRFQSPTWIDDIQDDLAIAASIVDAPINAAIQVGDRMVCNYLTARNRTMLQNTIYYNVESFSAHIHYHFIDVGYLELSI